MKVITLKRLTMIPQLEAAHIGAMVRLCRAFPGEDTREALTKADKIDVDLSEKMGTCAGRARTFAGHTAGGIKLNARLLAINPDQLIPTYLHELAHVVANLIYKQNCGHGPLWKKVMFVLGVSDERCHSMDTSAFAKRQRRFLYECMKCARPFHLTLVRHKKQQARLSAHGSGAYLCKCRGNLEHKP